LFIAGRFVAAELAEMKVDIAEIKKQLNNLESVMTKIYQLFSEKNNPLSNLPDEVALLLPLSSTDDIKKLEGNFKRPPY